MKLRESSDIMQMRYANATTDFPQIDQNEERKQARKVRIEKRGCSNFRYRKAFYFYLLNFYDKSFIFFTSAQQNIVYQWFYRSLRTHLLRPI